MKRIIFLLTFSGVLVTGYAQNFQSSEWNIYLQEYRITDVADAGDYLWLTAYKVNEDYSWHATNKEIIQFEKATGNTIHYGTEILGISSDDFIETISCDDNGLPWAGGTFPGILRMTEDDEWILIPPLSTKPFEESIHEILVTEDGVVWASSLLILNRYDGEMIDTFRTNGTIISLAEDNMGNLWLGTANFFVGHYEGLVKFDGDNWTIFNSSPTGIWPAPGLGNIIIGENGTIWMSGFLGLDYPVSKLIKFDDSQWQVYDPPRETIICTLALADDNMIWIGTEKGLMKYTNSQWTVFDTENSELPGNIIYSIIIDDYDTKWLGTNNGLVSFKENGLKTPAIQKPIMVSEFELFPNPAHDFIILKMPLELTNSKIDILNIEGRTIKTINVNKNNNRVDVKNLSSGIYIVKIQTDENFLTRMFVKD